MMRHFFCRYKFCSSYNYPTFFYSDHHLPFFWETDGSCPTGQVHPLSMCRHLNTQRPENTKQTSHFVSVSLYKSVGDIFHFLQNQGEESKTSKHFCSSLRECPFVCLFHACWHTVSRSTQYCCLHGCVSAGETDDS